MKVAWDARPLYAPELRGIGHYAANLLDALVRADTTLEIMLFHDAEQPPPRALPAPGRRVGSSRGYRWQLWERVALPWHAYRAQCDVLHSLANTTPPHATLPRVVTVHDVIPYLPGFEGSLPLRYHRVAVPDAVRRASLVLTDSECSRQDVIRVFHVRPDRVRVIPLAVSPGLHPPAREDRERILQQLRIASPYCLALAATARRKNTDGVLRVFKRIAARNRMMQLVLTGVGPVLEKTLRSLMSDYEIPASRVTLLPFVDDRTLAALYAGTEAFLFLSRYEGFGIPILEAMRCEAPVICSTRSSCPEVAGDAAAMVDPDDEDSAADLVLAVSSEDANARQARRARGAAREKTFTWQRTAELTLAAYLDVVRQ